MQRRRHRRRRRQAGRLAHGAVDAGEEGDEELVRVVLLVAGKVLRRAPHRVDERVRRQRRLRAGEARRKDGVHLAAEARLEGAVAAAVALRLPPPHLADVPVVAVREEEASDRRAVHEDLEDAIHEARLAEVVEPPEPEQRQRQLELHAALRQRGRRGHEDVNIHPLERH